MALTNEDKCDLKLEVKRLKELGYSKTEAVEKIHYAYLWKKSTIRNYWKIFNESEESK